MAGGFDPARFRDLISGRRRGPTAAALRVALRLIETPYTWAVAARNGWYDRHPAAAQRVAAKVVSVGNLTVGGTGKTPMVEWLARWFLEHPADAHAASDTGGAAVAIISRGYGSRHGQASDEALELRQKLPEVPHVQDPDRVAAAGAAIARYSSRVLVLDDAFQHRRIARDLDIVLLDALEPFGFEHVFPRGTLREPVAGLRRADVVVLSRADLLEPTARTAIRNRVTQLAPHALWLEAAHVPQTLIAADGRRQATSELRGQPVLAFCGIGNPAGFAHTLSACGMEVVGWRAFPDHHRYTERDIAELAAAGRAAKAAALVCTLKDLVKIGRPSVEPPCLALAVQLAVLSGEESLQQRLAAI